MNMSKMNREIKFRIGSVGEIYYGKINQCINMFEYSPSCYIDLDSDWVLMQYTGLKDKNGKEIYEDDIVLINAFGKQHTTPVIYKEGVFGTQWKEYTTTSTVLKITNWFTSIEVIGNIYENPELLKHVSN